MIFGLADIIIKRKVKGNRHLRGNDITKKKTGNRQMERMRLRAYGKINLGLDVVRKREDGYHELRMIMQTVGIYDSIYLTVTEEPGIILKTDLRFLPTGEGNLAYRGAKLLMDEFHITKGLEISLHKYLPVAAGLAGGSSDCAAVLVGVNRLFHLGLSKETLMAKGLSLGADVPYCLLRGTALAEGIGEKLTRLPEAPQCTVLLVKPRVFVSTKYVYGNFRLDEVKKHPDIDGMIEAIRKGSLEGVCGCMENVLETVTERDYPIIGQIKEIMLEYGAANAMMSGSGPTVFGLFSDEQQAGRAKKAILRRKMAGQIYMTDFFQVKEQEG